MQGKVLIITIGGHEAGMGHVMRCLSLAMVLWNEKIDVIFYCDEDIACKKIESEKFKIIRIGNIDKAIDEEKPTVLFIDLPPHINRSCYIDSAKKRRIISIAFDDMLINGEKTDVIINPSLKSPLPPFSKRGIGGIYYDGAEYSVINDSFYSALPPLTKGRNNRDVRDILITMGGSDPARQTEKILDGLIKNRVDANIDVVVGVAYKNKSEVRSQKSEVRIHKDIKNMAGLMAKAGIAFVAGGITIYEAASIGLPVIVIAQDRYQEMAAMEFQRRGFGKYLGFFSDVTEEMIFESFKELAGNYDIRKSMSDTGRKIVDGKGVFRVAEIIKSQGLGISS